jgi:hypothetical protein
MPPWRPMLTSTDNEPRTVSCLQQTHDVSARRRFEALAHSWMKLASDLEMAKVAAQVAAVRSCERTYWESRGRRFTPLDG